MSRDPQVTPLKLVDEDEENPLAPGLSVWQRLGRGVAFVSALGTLIGTVFVVSRFAVVEPIAEATEKIEKKLDEVSSKEELERKLEDEKRVTKELYIQHVKTFEEQRKEAKEERKEIQIKLDALGKRAYHSERRWKEEISE